MRKIYIPLFLSVASIAVADSKFHFNVAGYDSDQPKSLVVESSDMLTGVDYAIKKDGASVATGTFGTGSYPTNWTNGFYVYYNVDFSQVKTPGSYTIEFTKDGTLAKSATFDIADKKLASKTLGMVLGYFYADRSSASLHTKVAVEGSSGKYVDVHGGWSDASGDQGKYLSHLSYANYMNPQQIPLTVWALAFAAERIPTTVATAKSDGFALDEALWGADFLVRMLSDEGYFYMTVFNKWNKVSEPWSLCAFVGKDGDKYATYQTAYREGGGMSIAALAKVSTFGKNGVTENGKYYTPSDYLNAAKKGFEHLESKQTLGGECTYCDDGKENIIDDYTALFAAMELYNATKDSKYWTVAQNRASHLIGRLSDDGYFWSDNAKSRPFYHASDAGLPLVALVRYLELETSVEKATAVRAAVKKHLDWMISVTDRKNNHFGYAKQVVKIGEKIQTNFFIPHDNETNYWWQGESARLGSLASAAVYASRMLNYADSVKAYGYAADQLDWLLGKNPYDLSVMKGVGKVQPRVYQTYTSTTLDGGIANGITGKNTDGSGIVWDDMSAAGFSSLEDWQYWRWVEQWIPHATWYLMALATRYDEHPVPGAAVEEKPEFVQSQVAGVAGYSISQTGRSLHLEFATPAERRFKLLDTKGRVQVNQILHQARNEVNLTAIPKGIYLVQVQGFAPKKIVVK